MKYSFFILSILFHVLGMSALVAGSLQQILKSRKTITITQLYGAFIALGSGLSLALLQESAAPLDSSSQAKIATKLIVAISICIITSMGISRRRWSSGYYIASFLVVSNIFAAILWKP